MPLSSDNAAVKLKEASYHKFVLYYEKCLVLQICIYDISLKCPRRGFPIFNRGVFINYTAPPSTRIQTTRMRGPGRLTVHEDGDAPLNANRLRVRFEQVGKYSRAISTTYLRDQLVGVPVKLRNYIARTLLSHLRMKVRDLHVILFDFIQQYSLICSV